MTTSNKPAPGETAALAAYRPLIESLAKKYASGRDLREDLIQVGSLAFVIAYREAADRKVSPLTIEEAVRRETCKRNDDHDQSCPLATVSGRVAKDLKCSCVPVDAKTSRRRRPAKRFARADRWTVTSLDAPCPTGDGSSLHYVYGVAPTQEEIADLAMRARAVDRGLNTLTPMERAVLGARTSDAPPTLDAVATALGLSSSRRAQEVEQRAISKLTAACAEPGPVAA